MPDLEPFADKVWSVEGALSAPQYRVGYRFPATQAVLTQLEIPARIIEQAVLTKLLVVPIVTPDGTVTAYAGQSDFDTENQLEVAAIPINELVKRAMAPENLRLEETTISDLHTLLVLLEQSVANVKTTIAMAVKTS